MDIDWLSTDSHVLLNPRMPEEERRRLDSFVVDLPGHVWLSTSGTTGALKLTALSKHALLASAAAVNRHLQSDDRDVWLCVLPTFHVGGLGIYARAFLSGARVVTSDWEGVTLASLVPAQVSDLVRDRVVAPPSLRAVVVGGGALSEELYAAARTLGWPLLPSYGMTECCSQVATATPDVGRGFSPPPPWEGGLKPRPTSTHAPELLLLDHIEARIESDGRLALRSESLLTGYATENGFVDPKADGWFVTEDLASLRSAGRRPAGPPAAGRSPRILEIQGRRGDFVKIGGESVDLSRLDRILAAVVSSSDADAAVFPIPDERLGHVIALAVASGDPDAIAAAFNARVFPFERARRIVRVPEIPRTPLGKIIRSRLK